MKTMKIYMSQKPLFTNKLRYYYILWRT